jgi:CheY-like chemotaxis protein
MDTIQTNRKMRVLIAEDDETSEMMITILVKKITDDILIARNGLEAVESFRNNQDVDLILMDMKMPIMSGSEATREIRAFNKNVIIIAQTAYALKGDREKAIEIGCNDYITKPFRIDDLHLLIQKHLAI